MDDEPDRRLLGTLWSGGLRARGLVSAKISLSFGGAMSGGRSRWLVLVTAVVALFVLPGGGPAAASQPAHGLRAVPAPIDPTPGNRSPQRRGSARAVPRTIARNPLLKEVLSEEQEGADDPGRDLSALCQDGVGKPNPYRNPAPNVDQIVGDTIVTVGQPDRLQLGAEREHHRRQPGEPQEHRRRHQRLPGLQQPRAAQRRLGLGLHHASTAARPGRTCSCRT